jgi:hypothetical protein
MIVMETIIDPVALVDRLEPDAIRERLGELDRQVRALRVLLRAAIARERRAQPTHGETTGTRRGGPPDAP